MSVWEFLRRKRERDLGVPKNFVRLFEEGEEFDIRKVLNPPKEHFDKMRAKVLEDAFKRAENEVIREDEDEDKIDREELLRYEKAEEEEEWKLKEKRDEIEEMLKNLEIQIQLKEERKKNEDLEEEIRVQKQRA